MSELRLKKVESLLVAEISGLISGNQLKDPRIEFAGHGGGRTRGQGSYSARIYVSYYGEEAVLAATVAALNHAPATFRRASAVTCACATREAAVHRRHLDRRRLSALPSSSRISSPDCHAASNRVRHRVSHRVRHRVSPPRQPPRRQPRSAAWCCWDKPEGVSSFQCLGRIKRVLGTRRVGHVGTLDPFASGLIGALTHRCTRLARLLSGLDKCYLATVRFGAETDTLDTEGRTIAAGAGARLCPGDAATPAASVQRPAAAGAAGVLGGARRRPAGVRHCPPRRPSGAAGTDGNRPTPSSWFPGVRPTSR